MLSLQSERVAAGRFRLRAWEAENAVDFVFEGGCKSIEAVHFFRLVFDEVKECDSQRLPVTVEVKTTIIVGIWFGRN